MFDRFVVLLLFFPRCFDPVVFLFFVTTLFFCPFFLSLYAYYSRYCFFASVFLFSFMFRLSFFHNISFLSIVPCCLLFFYFLSVYISFMHSFFCCFYTRTFVLLYMFYDVFSCLRPFDLFFLLSSGCFSGFAIVFYFLASFKGFLRIYAAPDIRTGSDRFVPSFPICFANDRLLPYRSDVSLLSFNCRGCFIPIPPCFFLNDALVFFRLCRLSVAFLSAFSSCFGQGSLCLFFFCFTPCFCPFSVSVHLFWIISFGLSVFQQKKRISALFVCFSLFFRLLLLPL